MKDKKASTEGPGQKVIGRDLRAPDGMEGSYRLT